MHAGPFTFYPDHFYLYIAKWSDHLCCHNGPPDHLCDDKYLQTATNYGMLNGMDISESAYKLGISYVSAIYSKLKNSWLPINI